MYRGCDRMVTVGPGYLERLVDKGVDRGKVDVFANGIDTRRFTPRAPDEAFASTWNPDGRKVCSYIGTIGLACGLDVVLESAQKLQAAGNQDVLGGSFP